MWALLALTGGVVGFVALLSLIVQSAPKMSLQHRRVLITGGSQGIGLAIATLLARRGCRVVITARGVDQLNAAVMHINSDVKPAHIVSFVAMDVSSQTAVEGSMSAVHQKLGGPPEIVICCAGFSYPTRFLDCPAAEAERMMQVNYFGCVNVVRSTLPAMLTGSFGRVVLVSSMASDARVAGFTLYSPTKAALMAFGQALDMEVACRGVRCQVVLPPDVETPGYAAENKVKSEECKRICAMGGVQPFSSQHMAEAVVDGVENYRFKITLGFDGFMMKVGTAGLSAPSSIGEVLVEVLLAGIVRLVGCVYTKLHYAIVKDVVQNERRKGKSD